MCLLAGIGIFVICCLSLEFYAFDGANEIIGTVSATLFLVASSVVLIGVCFALAEMRCALDPITQESALVEDMVRQFDGIIAPALAAHFERATSKTTIRHASQSGAKVARSDHAGSRAR